MPCKCVTSPRTLLWIKLHKHPLPFFINPFTYCMYSPWNTILLNKHINLHIFIGFFECCMTSTGWGFAIVKVFLHKLIYLLIVQHQIMKTECTSKWAPILKSTIATVRVYGRMHIRNDCTCNHTSTYKWILRLFHSRKSWQLWSR